MGFMRAYKHLDQLCRDMNGLGITGYIEDMEGCAHWKRQISGWEEDCRQLKHYRSVRNQIVHETDAEEEDLSDAADEDWLDGFYDRILAQQDPLALYCQMARTMEMPKAQKHCRHSRPGPKPAPKQKECPEPRSGWSSEPRLFLLASALLLAVVAAALMFLVSLF